MDESLRSLRVQLLAWLAQQPRTYDQVMEAWCTRCPRHPVWEDAVSDGLVHIEPGARRGASVVILSEQGRAVLASAGTTT